ncbi:NAD(P)-dependent oxidoreductase [Pseudorhodoplanes sinuspersici]|uniref:6-phosphogluconate dehydrogenase n=1 Tax=Pseudorhodoplanes sinuspersici TaxID=1235591 RepID=A0A1W6ZTL3_9HYPH|nr:NAD(P)-binding domain-containing protein [Pseudorhodoplanes sinuspersici]ARQ00461.1 6-phosphogluconate dehydrogenase [Pseudorhodoplanes sinuspersici]RKE67365.1 3-hydroxyisobutyrate dehydrogenase-like beta-hydroxyacid dehydrogenase [Pseudorhodoplanes sinuspersici]
MQETRKEICVVGAGRMGSALVRAFLKRGYPTSVWNRTAAKSEPLVALGARTSGSLETAIAPCDIIVVNVIDYAAADELLRSPSIEAALKSKLIVQLTSGSPQQARDSGAWAGRHGIGYLDGAIMATPNFIGEPEGTVLYSGPHANFDQNKELFLALGGNALHVGEDFGHASALDVALLTQMWGTLFGTLQAIAVSVAEGIDLKTYDKYRPTFRPTVEGAVDDLLARARDGRYRGDENTLASLAAHHGAFQHLLDVTRDRGLNPALPHALDGLFKAAIAKGHLHDDFAALVPLMR